MTDTDKIQEQEFIGKIAVSGFIGLVAIIVLVSSLIYTAVFMAGRAHAIVIVIALFVLAVSYAITDNALRKNTLQKGRREDD